MEKKTAEIGNWRKSRDHTDNSIEQIGRILRRVLEIAHSDSNEKLLRKIPQEGYDNNNNNKDDEKLSKV